MAEMSPITIARFWSKVAVSKNQSDCWEWQGTLNDGGYGRFSVGRLWLAAHRVAYELVNGPIPDGHQIRHRCHNRKCCNPDHLLTGSAQDNSNDALEAGKIARGSASPASKLTEEDVIYIRRNPDGLQGNELAEKFGVAASTISYVRRGRGWDHVR